MQKKIIFVIFSGITGLISMSSAECIAGVRLSAKSEYTSDRKYYRVCQSVTNIPDNMQSDAFWVVIQGNLLTVIKPNVFNTLSECVKIILSYNDLHTISVDAFRDLVSLESLDLSHNQLRKLQQGVFNDIKALKKLTLDSNKLSGDELHEGLFDQLSSLEELSIQKNGLMNLEPGLFVGLSELTKLDISYNELTTLDSEVFKGLPSLTVLWMSNNKLTRFPWTLFSPSDYSFSSGHPTSLQVNLRYNEFLCHPDTICWMKNAKTAGWFTTHSSIYYGPYCVDQEKYLDDVSVTCPSLGKCLHC